MKKDLVAYFSASGVTAGLAKRLALAIGADVYEIRPVTPYSERDLDWTDPASRSSIEMKDKSYRPPIIVSDLPDAQTYDRIFVGFPIWWYVAPRIIETFLESYDFNGKTVYTFSTSGSSSGSGAYNFLSSEYEEIGFVGYFHSTSSQLSSAQTRVASWLDEIGLAA